MKKSVLVMFAILAGCAPALLAQQSAVTMHLFGGWAYGKTNGNEYLDGTRAGGYDNVNVALNLSASPTDKLRLEGQLAEDVDVGVKKTSVDFAFGEWRFSDRLRLRAGRMKHPFGIYTEVFDVGTLRPFFALPQAVYGPVGTLAEAYSGVGVSGFRKLGSDWSVSYDVYAGELDLPFDDFASRHAEASSATLQVKHAAGGRAVFDTPLQGLRVGGSAYSGTIRESSLRRRHTAGGLQAEYVTDRLSLRSELTANSTGFEGEHAGYLECGWRFTPHWQGAVLVDALRENIDRDALGSKHQEVGVGINYWFTPQFVLKLSAHHVDGFHLAGPDPVSGLTKRNTDLLMFGAQFSF
jgi:hypothetical protein